MKYDPDIHHRRSIRLKEYDYSQEGAYFITICVQNRDCLFGKILDDEMILNDAGQMIETMWCRIPSRFPEFQIDEFIVMPNHFHGILISVGANLVFAQPGNAQPGNAQPGIFTQNGNVGQLNKEGENKERKNNKEGDHKDRPYGTLDGSIGRVIQAFKSLTGNAYITGVCENKWPEFDKKLWQRNYYEHVIRNNADYNRILEYIQNNPGQWQIDELYYP